MSNEDEEANQNVDAQDDGGVDHLIWFFLKWLMPIGLFVVTIVLFIMLMIAAMTTTQESCYVDQSGGNLPGNWRQKGSKSNNAMKYSIDEFKKLGMSGPNIAAALAEGVRESNFDPNAYNTGGGVSGIWQWSYGGVNGNRFGSMGKSVEDQVALAIKELKGPYHVTLVTMQGADINTSVNMWATHFEGLPPNDAAQRKHTQTVATANEIQKLFNLNFEGHLDGHNSTIDNGNNNGNAGAANDLSNFDGDTNGTTSGLPVQGRYNITGGYPDYDGSTGAEHFGVDFQTVNNDGAASNVYAVGDGVVVAKKFDPIGGNQVVLKMPDGKYTYYGRAPSQDAIVVNVGDKVKKGQHISHQGQTGLATGVHVHFGVNTQRINFGPNAPGITSPGNYLTNLPRKVVPDNKTVVPGGPFNAK